MLESWQRSEAPGSEALGHGRPMDTVSSSKRLGEKMNHISHYFFFLAVPCLLLPVKPAV